jgi:hypothetical protein
LADAAGVSPRVVQKLMRHSTLELTGRYTRPRAVDIENAASMLPSLKPKGDQPELMALTGTDPTHQQTLAPYLLHFGDSPGRSQSLPDAMTLPISGAQAHSSTNEKTPEFQGFDASSRAVSRVVASVPKVGLEPTPPLQGPDFESGASAIPPLRLG